jgi:hypothetical protein
VTDLWPLIFGTVFIVFVLFAPQGIWGILTGRLRSRDAPESVNGGKEASGAAT